jgi:hypothetical protein
MHLFSYRYDRTWPPSLDATVPLVMAGVGAVALSLLLAVTRTRRAATFASVGLALVWAVWGLDRYLPEASPHWGQRAIFEAYYGKRAGPQEPIVAYRLNWKGENFYTGSRLPQFGVPTPPPNSPAFPDWVKEQKAHGTKVMYFVTEQHGVAGLRKELTGIKVDAVDTVTTHEDSNQFALVRAVL